MRLCVELQTSRHERVEAEQKLSKLTAENDELVQRLVEMKATEVERMNEVNRTCDEMVIFSSSSFMHPVPVQYMHSCLSACHRPSVCTRLSLSTWVPVCR